MRTHVVHWSDLVPKLPFASDSASKRKRRELFDACDPRGIGLLSQAEVVRYYFRLLPPVSGVVDMKKALDACFRAAREAIEPVVHIGSQQLERNQFRVFLMSVWYYVKIWECFCTLDETGERVANLDNFMKVLPAMVQWGFGAAVADWISDPLPIFRLIDLNDVGEVSFDELAEFCLRHGLQKLGAENAEEERKEALDLLGRTHPQLAAKVAPSTAGLKYSGSAPPVPPPGQKVPPTSAPSSSGPSPREAMLKQRRWSSQYMADFVVPSRHSSRPGSAAVSLVPTPARSRPLSRTSFSSGRADGLEILPRQLRRHSSVPSAPSSAASSADGNHELDRNALRSRLEQDLGMYSTCQMRRILEVAGGMVLGPKS
uniref:EF-hand domain-containing protein n=1 Tax=Alexandrium catenella TaxID=2925 RepID=A0A7S1RWS0_ALECA|mmetsp:Transcript_7599/g.20598  ORF Transcript_7599/g.20598 Transcript_7599/m.20598 type:complete len:372 (+) Transcript_7599:58-1173(+)